MKIHADHVEGEHFLSPFARTVGSKVENGRVTIPEKYGSGYVLGFLLGNYLRLIVRHYEFKEDVVVKRQSDGLPTSMILISFKNILHDPKNRTEEGNEPRRPLPSVTITTQGLDSEFYIPGHTSFNAINLAIEASYLRQLLNPNIENTVLKNIIDNRQPLVFEQLVSAHLQQVASEIVSTMAVAPLQDLFYKVKSEELIYHLLSELLQREDSNIQSLNIADITMLYAVRDLLISDLAKAPALGELASYARMSKSKLKRLFAQVFGDSIYSYYQTIRMKEAAYLLKQKKQSVSEVGYALGFTNLSHFTRVFEDHIGMKPKKFSAL